MDEVVECSKEVDARRVGMHFRGVRGNSVQILCVREKRWRQPLPNSSQSVFYMQTVESSFWQDSVYRCATIKKSAGKNCYVSFLVLGLTINLIPNASLSFLPYQYHRVAQVFQSWYKPVNYLKPSWPGPQSLRYIFKFWFTQEAVLYLFWSQMMDFRDKPNHWVPI